MKYIPLALFLILFIGCKNTSVIVESNPMISITFDDGRDTIMNNALPIMKKYNVKGTMYITTGVIDDYGHVCEYDIQTLINNGWEIGAHTIYHDDLTKLSEEKIYENLIKPHWYLENTFNIEVKSFASPYGEYNDSIIQKVKQIYQSHVNAWSENKGINQLNDVNPYNVHRIDVTNEVSSDLVCKSIEALKNGEWYVLLFHNVVEEPKGNWDTSITKFEEIIKCASTTETKKISEVLK